MGSIISGIVAFVRAVPIIDDWVRMFIAAFVASEKSETLVLIADAAAMGARAKTQEDRYRAAEAWRRALSRDRVSL